ncbi:DUF2897 family protein [Alteromonas sp. CYL-A6]|uniref:DUF2897 family protein n=1 Tax=Alteromonas nitratireducens TaxID=3390813 RepID=UPI0034AC0218
MTTGWIIAIVLLVLGIVVGNLLLLKHSARLKINTRRKDGSTVKDNNVNFDDEDDWK